MHPKDEKFIKYWEKSSLMGRMKYALATVVFAIVTAIIIELGSIYVFHSSIFSFKSLIQRVLIMSLLGFFFGRWYWSSNEKRYQELIKRTSDGD